MTLKYYLFATTADSPLPRAFGVGLSFWVSAFKDYLLLMESKYAKDAYWKYFELPLQQNH